MLSKKNISSDYILIYQLKKNFMFFNNSNKNLEENPQIAPMFLNKKLFIIYLCLFISLIYTESPLKALKFSKNKEGYFVIISFQQDTKIASFGIRDDCFGVLSQNSSIKSSCDKVFSIDNELEININDLKWTIIYEYYVEVITKEGKIFNTEKFFFDMKKGNFVLSKKPRKLSVSTLN